MPKASPMSWDIVAILETCRDIELACAEIYTFYNERFSYDEELKVLWSKTALEEENHALQFNVAIKMRKDGVIVDHNADPIKATQILNMLKGILGSVKSHAPSEIDALSSSLKLEEKLQEFHLDYVAVFKDGHLKEMFTSMMSADQLHREAIEKVFLKRVGRP